MPELPEVETVVRGLRGGVVGRRVRSASVRWARTVGGDAAGFSRGVVGRRVEAIGRRGKYLVFALSETADGPGALVAHLRMSGRMHVRPAGARAERWTRLRLGLEGGGALDFVDVRKFGRVLFAASPDTVLPPLGPEPLARSFTGARLHAALARRRGRLKPLLLDQAFVAGLGNIYVDEALYAARLHPLTPAPRVSREQAAALHRHVRRLLRDAIAAGGSSFDGSYRTPDGQSGGYQRRFRVYGRAGEPCGRCKARVLRIVVAQRGTHLCPRCQRVPRSAA